MPRNRGAFLIQRTNREVRSVLVLAGMRGVRLLLVFGIELVVQIYEVVVEIIIQIIIVVVIIQFVVIQLFVVEVVHVVRPLVLDTILSLVIIFQIVLEILVLGVTFLWCLLRQPRFRFPLVRETPGGLQHG